jgi:DNA primase
LLIPEQKIEEILERVDLVALVSRHVELKKSGRSWKGRCPFHNEKSASFHVTPEMRRFKCFGCQAGGDAIAFVQRYLGKSFVDAVRDLAREVGVDLEAAADPTAKERQELREATALAHDHFKAGLWDERKGQKAREYLDSRGVPEEVSKSFGLGYAPAAWTDLADKLLAAGMLEWGLKAGLVAARTKSDGYYDVFRGRLIVPIRSPDGRTIAFGARLLEGEDGPKYLNSKESRLYNKSEVLFGMDLAKDEIRRQKRAVLVEGYFDCIGLHQVGVTNAVALCSTALTPGHLALLARSEAKELVLLLDGDEAGRKAVERLAGSLLAAGAATRVGLLPSGEDPDTFARKAGSGGVRALLDAARPLTEHLFSTVLPKGRGASFEEKMLAVDRVKPVAQALPVGLTRSAFFGALSGHFGLPAAELEVALRGRTPPLKPVPKPASPQGLAPATPPRKERPPDPLEAAFTGCVLKDPRLLAQDLFRAQDELTHLGLRALVTSAVAGQAAAEALEASTPLVRQSVERALQELRVEGAELTSTFSTLCKKVKVRRIDEQLKFISQQTRTSDPGGELNEETRRLLQDRVELLALKRRVLEEMGPGPPGTNALREPV